MFRCGQCCGVRSHVSEQCHEWKAGRCCLFNGNWLGESDLSWNGKHGESFSKCSGGARAFQAREREKQGEGLYTALGSQWADHSAYLWVFVLEAADGSEVVKIMSGFIPRRAGWREPLGELGDWRRTFPISPSWSFSLTTSYRPTVDGIHPPIHLPISSFHFTSFLSTGIYYAPILWEVLVKLQYLVDWAWLGEQKKGAGLVSSFGGREKWVKNWVRGAEYSTACSGDKQRRDNSRCHGRLSQRGAALVGSWSLK